MKLDRGIALRAGAWSAIESGGLSVLSFVTLIAFARLLTPTEFGVFGVALSAIELLALLPNMMFHDALVQRDTCPEEVEDTATAMSMTMAVAICCSCWLGAPLYSRLVGTPEAGSILGGLSIGLLFSASTTTIVARQKRTFGFRTLALRSLVGRLAGAAIGLIAAATGFGVWSLVIQWVSMQILGSAVLIETADRRPRLGFDRTHARELCRFGIPAVSALFASFAMRRVLMIAAGILLGPAATGLLNLAMRLVDTFWAIAATAVSQVALPALSALRDDPERRRSAYLEGFMLACAVFMPAFFGVAIGAPSVVAAIFGSRWLGAAPLLSMLALILVMPALRLLIPPFLTSLGVPRRLLLLNGTILALLVLGLAAAQPTSAAQLLELMALLEGGALLLFHRALAASTGIRLVDHLRAARAPAVATVAMMAIAWPVAVALRGAPGWSALIAIGLPGASVYLAAILCLAPAFAKQLRGRIIPSRSRFSEHP